MNLVEAAQTGRPFRRPADAKTYGAGWYCDLTQPWNRTVALDLGDILATDWEVQPVQTEEGSGGKEVQRTQG